MKFWFVVLYKFGQLLIIPSTLFNFIEEVFSKMKYWVRWHHEYYSIAEGNGIIYDMLGVLDIVTPSDGCSYSIRAGYF